MQTLTAGKETTELPVCTAGLKSTVPRSCKCKAQAAPVLAPLLALAVLFLLLARAKKLVHQSFPAGRNIGREVVFSVLGFGVGISTAAV